MKLSIIVPTYKRKDYLLNLLETLCMESKSEYEVIIVEQLISNENLFKTFARKNKINLHYVFLNAASTSHAKNVGAKVAKSEYLLFLDDDVIVEKGLIKNHLMNYKDSEIGGVAGRVITPGQKNELYNKNVGRITKLAKFTDGFSSTIKQEVDTVIGCNASWRKNVFFEVGGFDEQFTGNAMREESDLSLNVKSKGYKIIFEPKALVKHVRAETGGNRKTEGRLQWYYDFFSNETYFYLKHRPKILLPIMLLTRWEWAARCMFGFGREVSINSIITPFLGIKDGFRKVKML